MTIARLMIDCNLVSSGSRALSYSPPAVHGKGGNNAHQVKPTGVPDQPGSLRLHPQRQNHVGKTMCGFINHVWLRVEGGIGYIGPMGNTSGPYELFNLRGNP